MCIYIDQDFKVLAKQLNIKHGVAMAFLFTSFQKTNAYIFLYLQTLIQHGFAINQSKRKKK